MIYLDNAATTKMRSEVKEELINSIENDYANYDSIHGFGFEVLKKVENIRKDISQKLNVKKDEIYFTSGGSEGNNIIVRGIVEANKKTKKHMITSKIEHNSCYEIFKYYEKEGFDVTYISVDNNGKINIEEIEKAIREDTVLVSIIGVNSEIGTLQDISKISNVIKNKNSNVYFHTDFVQGFGHYNIDTSKIDAMTVSAHKIYGPKGVGFIYIKNNTKINPIQFGAGQEKNLVPRTLNSTSILAFGEAINLIYKNQKQENEYLQKLKIYTIEKISFLDVRLNSLKDIEESAPHILNFSIKGIKGEVVVHFLETNKIYISTGSACSTKKGNSRILLNLGLDQSDVEGGLRVSFSIYNTFEEIDIFVEKLEEAVKIIKGMR